MSLRSMFKQFFTQFRGGSVCSVMFSFRDSDDTWVRVDTTGGGNDGNHVDISVADAGTGLATLTFPKCRHVRAWGTIDAGVSTFGSQRTVVFGAGTYARASAGSLPIYIYKDDETSGVPGLLDPVDGSILTVNLYLAK